jgi:hypothetical protein
VVLAAVAQTGAGVMEFLSEELKADKDVVLVAAAKNGYALAAWYTETRV